MPDGYRINKQIDTQTLQQKIRQTPSDSTGRGEREYKNSGIKQLQQIFYLPFLPVNNNPYYNIMFI